MPTLQDSGAGQQRVEFAEFVEGSAFARGVGQAKVSDFAGQPLRPMVDLAAEHDSRADIGADMNQDEGLFCLGGAAVALAHGGEVDIVFHDHQAVDDPAQLRGEWNRAPVFQGADGKHQALIHVSDSRDTDHQGQQLFPLLTVLAQQAPDFFSDEDANCVWGCLSLGKRNGVGVHFLPIQVREQEGKAIRGKL